MTHAVVDSLIVGGGPAGLTAATYLGRFRRSVVIVDDGDSRLKRIPLSRNIPGFPEGVSGRDMHARLMQQAGRYGAKLLSGRVAAIAHEDGLFCAETPAGLLRAKTVLLATGVAVADPEIDGLDDAVRLGLIRYCPICDGFEAGGRRIAVLGARPHSIEEALFLRTYSSNVAFVPMDAGVGPSEDEAARAKAAGVELEDRKCVSLARLPNAVQLRFADGAARAFDVVYPCLGTEPRSELARNLGAQVSTEGELLTDKHQRTNIPGLFAAGDVLRGLDQVASACGQAAIAATAMHNLLREREAG